ncbi:Phage tail protein [Vibrio crassostreae]|nr:Phage tail protein [Vibrio crassostreae]CAK3437202.1 Phage tail protein [Vibrio crassostreae]CAK3943316.1 Phage tail protein [Vibrio crassostreae]
MGETDFTSMGRLVDKASELLDSIKGGAIRTMENAFDAFMATVNSEWAAKKSQVDNEALAAIQRVETQTVINSLGYTAMNINDDFSLWKELTNSAGDKQLWPVDMAFYNDSASHARNILTPEKIEVPSGVEVDQRPAVVQELIQYAGFGGKHFPRGGFNILKMTATGASVGKRIDLGFAGGSLESAGGFTYLVYIRSPQTNNQWQLQRSVVTRQLGGYGYAFPATKFDFEPGDEIYIALPTLTAGAFPVGTMHGMLPNEPRARYHATN